MADIETMDLVPGSAGQGSQSHEKEKIVIAVGVSPWIAIPTGVRKTSFTLSFTSTAEGSIETTPSKIDTIENLERFPSDKLVFYFRWNDPSIKIRADICPILKKYFLDTGRLMTI